MLTVRMNNRGQITIPSAIRNQFGLNNGDEIALIAEENHIIIFPKKEKNIEAAFGLYKAKVSVSLEGMEKAIQEGASNDFH